MTCVHLTHLERAAGTICPQCVANAAVANSWGPEAERLSRRRRVIRRRIRGAIRTLLPWLATGAMIFSFVWIIYFINLLTNAQNGAS